MSTISIHDAMFAPAATETAAPVAVIADADRRLDPMFFVGLGVGITFWVGGTLALWSMVSLLP
ncbi:MAG: hypothetical protein RI885_1719 [Actinomycetota bacterium]